MLILCFWLFLRFWAQNAPNPTRFYTFALFSGLERWHRAENSLFSTQKEKYISKPDLNIFCLFSPPRNPLHLLEHVPEKVLGRGEILKAGSQRCWNNVQPFFNRRGLIGWHFNRNLSAANLVLVPVREHFKQNIQALAKTLIMNYLPFAKETERSEILLIIRKIHDMFICCACFLFCCNHIRTTCD